MTNDTKTTAAPPVGRTRRGGRSPLSTLGSVTLALLMVVGLALASTGAADAAAYTRSVYPPDRVSTATIRGWANTNLDCSGTSGCWSYIKIERRRAWGNQFVAGRWITKNGWDSVSATLPRGCFNYRTTVNSYNDVAGSYGRGVNIGNVGISANGTKVYRYKSEWSSGWKRHCR